MGNADASPGKVVTNSTKFIQMTRFPCKQARAPEGSTVPGGLGLREKLCWRQEVHGWFSPCTQLLPGIAEGCGAMRMRASGTRSSKTCILSEGQNSGVSLLRRGSNSP